MNVKKTKSSKKIVLKITMSMTLRVHPSISSRSDLGLPPWSDSECWHPGMDVVFGEQFAEREGFGFIIKTHKPLEQETFQRQMKETFSLLAEKGCVHFKMVDPT